MYKHKKGDYNMEYLPPVINHVHNKLNTHLTLKLNYSRYSIPALATTKLDFDIMSKATGAECTDIYGAIREGYISVDILVLKNGEYTKVGSYSAEKADHKPVTRPVVNAPKKAADIAKNMGITVKDVDIKKESVTKVETEEKPALDPIKAINNPKVRTEANTATKKEEKPKTALAAVKNNTEKDK